MLHYERTVLPLRATILDETLREHNAMQVGPAALLLAKTAQVEAGSRYVAALADYWSARVALDRAVGAELGADAQEEKR